MKKMVALKKPIEFAMLTNEIYKSWSGMKASEYKVYKSLRIAKSENPMKKQLINQTFQIKIL